MSDENNQEPTVRRRPGFAPLPKLGPPKPEDTPHAKVTEIPVPYDKLLDDLKRYRQLAIDLGAEDAAIVPGHEIPQDIRVYYKCCIPVCSGFGSSMFCPPHWKTPWEEAKKIVGQFKYAIVYKVKSDTAKYTGPVNGYEAKKRLYHIMQTKKLPENETREQRETYGGRPRFLGSISSGVESAAYYDGYSFAMCFAVGSCRSSLCSAFGTCKGLEEGVCRFPFKARPCGSPSLYIDYTTLARRLGWKLLQAGYSVWPEDVPNHIGCYNLGLVLID